MIGSPERFDQTKPAPDDVIARGLDRAQALGVIRSWTALDRRSKARSAARWYRVTFPNGIAATWTPAAVLAFSLGVRLTSEREAIE